MAKRDYTQNQVIRLDGSGCFMEVLNDAFEIGRVHFGFYSYDTKRAEGSRFTNNIQIYMTIPEFLAFAQEVTSGRLYRAVIAANEKKAREGGYPQPVFINMGGTSADKLKRQGQARPDGKSISRQLKINPGTKKPFLLNAEDGTCEIEGKGLIKPLYNSGNAEQKVMVPLDFNMMLMLVETVKMHLQAYLVTSYINKPVTNPRNNTANPNTGNSSNYEQYPNQTPPASAQRQYSQPQQQHNTPPPPTRADVERARPQQYQAPNASGGAGDGAPQANSAQFTKRSASYGQKYSSQAGQPQQPPQPARQGQGLPPHPAFAQQQAQGYGGAPPINQQQPNNYPAQQGQRPPPPPPPPQSAPVQQQPFPAVSGDMYDINGIY